MVAYNAQMQTQVLVRTQESFRNNGTPEHTVLSSCAYGRVHLSGILAEAGPELTFCGMKASMLKIGAVGSHYMRSSRQSVTCHEIRYRPLSVPISSTPSSMLIPTTAPLSSPFLPCWCSYAPYSRSLAVLAFALSSEQMMSKAVGSAVGAQDLITIDWRSSVVSWLFSSGF